LDARADLQFHFVQDAMPPDGEFVCTNCHQSFEATLPTCVIVVDVTNEGGGIEQWFHDQTCLAEWETRGGRPRP
jgi:hypothetical protein